MFSFYGAIFQGSDYSPLDQPWYEKSQLIDDLVNLPQYSSSYLHSNCTKKETMTGDPLQ